MEHVKRFAYTGGQQRSAAQLSGKIDAGEDGDADSDDEDVPDLVSNFDLPSKDEANVAKTTDTTAPAGIFSMLCWSLYQIKRVTKFLYQ